MEPEKTLIQMELRCEVCCDTVKFICPGCKTKLYCSMACFYDHRDIHKKACQIMKDETYLKTAIEKARNDPEFLVKVKLTDKQKHIIRLCYDLQNDRIYSKYIDIPSDLPPGKVHIYQTTDVKYIIKVCVICSRDTSNIYDAEINLKIQT